MAGEEADADDAGHGGDATQEFGQVDFAGAVEAVAVHDLAEEDDFAHAAGGEIGGFGEDAGRRA